MASATSPAPAVLRGPTARALLWFGALVVLPYFAPLPWGGLLPRFRTGTPPATELPSTPAHGDAPPSVPLASAQAKGAVQPGEGIEDPSGRALDGFFEALRRAQQGRGTVRICHYGDSPITGDLITRTLRSGLQARFGDAGHGFVLLGRPWAWYGHEGVALEQKGFKATPLFLGKGDGLFGLGGATFQAGTAGAFARVKAAAAAFEIAYLMQPGGGDFELELDGKAVGRLPTHAEARRSAFERIETEAEAGPHTLTITAAGGGPVRLFGVVLESGRPGLQYDSLGVNGAFIGLYAHQMERDHWQAQLAHRRPDLVILNFGANESQYDDWPLPRYERDTREVVARVRAALPQASILFMGPMDRAVRGPDGELMTRATIPRLVAHQRRLAAEQGCAFFDTYEAMGGAGTAARWYAARPRLMSGDFLHPTVQGSEIVGGLVRDALLQAFERSH